MSFFQVDDEFFHNRKVMALVDGEGFAAASQALTVWLLCGSFARGAGLDGVVSLAQAARATSDRPGTKRGAGLLVRYGLWHEPGHACEVCPQPPEGSWVFHDWFQFGYSTGAAERVKTAKSKELRNAAIVEAVWARDTDQDGTAHCRYCGKRVRRPSRSHGGDRRSATLGQLDHVDPTKAIGASNIVVTCAECNQHKAQRTPEQSGMTLRPPPARASGQAGADRSGSTRDQVSDQDETKTAIKTESSSEVSPPRARPRAGAGGARDGVLVGSGGEGPAAGRAGPAPPVEVAGRWGSPWKGHHGRPPAPDLVLDATCPEHGHPMPCRDCLGP